MTFMVHMKGSLIAITEHHVLGEVVNNYTYNTIYVSLS